MGHEDVGEKLRAARLARGWTLEDVAVALHQLGAEVGESESRADLGQVSKWERGVRNPGRRYQARLCLVFDAMPSALGFAESPTLMGAIGDLRRRRQATAGMVPGLPEVDRERLTAALRLHWPADRALLAGLERAGRELAARTDAGPAGEVLPDLQAYLDALHELMGRSHPADLADRLRSLASAAAQHASFLSDAVARPRSAYALSAEAEALAREGDDRNRLAEVLVDRAEQLSRRAHGPEELHRPVALAEAASLTMDEAAPAGLRGWVEGQLSADLAAQGDDRRSGRHLEAALQAGDQVADLNLFSDLDSAWLEAYRGLRALHLGRAGEAIETYDEVLRRTDRRLLWERARALYRLAWAYALAEEIEPAAERLAEAIAVTSAQGDRRGVEAAARIRDRHLGRWRADPAVRRLDEAIRAAR